MTHTSGLIFRTAGPWGAGKGSDLTPAEVDGDFHDLDERVDTLETNPPTPVEISNITVTGASMTVHMADSSTFGPFTLPTAAFDWRGTWAALTQYFVNDVFFAPGDGVFLVVTDFESATAFDPGGAEVAKMLPDAAQWFTGAGAPAGGLGDLGDLYLDTANGDVYEHQGGGGWVVVDNITGPTGANGADGADGAAGADGADGTIVSDLGDVPDVDYTTAGPAELDVMMRRSNLWVHEPGAGRQTIWLPAAALQPTVTAGMGDHNSAPGLAIVELTPGRANVTYLPADSASEQNAQFSVGMPKSWDLGPLFFQAVYSHAGGQTAGLDGVAWGLKAVAVGDGENIDVAFGTEVVVTKDASAANTEHKTAISAALTPAGTLAKGDTVYFNLARKVGNGADDLDLEARLHGVKLFYATDALTDD